MIINDALMNNGDKPIMFNPMGLAVFDIAIGHYYLNKLIEMNIGTFLD